MNLLDEEEVVPKEHEPSPVVEDFRKLRQEDPFSEVDDKLRMNIARIINKYKKNDKSKSKT